MKIVEAKSLTDKTDFNSYSDWDTHPTAEIKCSDCKEKISINLANLRKHQLSNFSNLTPEENSKMETFIQANLKALPTSFLDYYCPNCGQPTKILYDSGAGGKHGEYGYKLKFIISG